MGLGLILASILPLAPSDDWWIRALDFPRTHFAVLLVVEIALAWVLLNRRRWATQALLAGLVASLGLQLHRPVALHAAASRPGPYGIGMSRGRAILDRCRQSPCQQQRRRSLPRGGTTREIQTWSSWSKSIWAGFRPCCRWRAVIPTAGSIRGRTSGDLRSIHASRCSIRKPAICSAATYRPSRLVCACDPVRKWASTDFTRSHPCPARGPVSGTPSCFWRPRRCAQGGRPAVLGGDLNTVAWSATSSLVQRIGGLLDPRVGRGPYATFPTWLPAPLRVPIDHVLFTPEFRLLDLERLPDIGSDHLPLFAALCHTPDQIAPANQTCRHELWRPTPRARGHRGRARGRRPFRRLITCSSLRLGNSAASVPAQHAATDRPGRIIVAVHQSAFVSREDVGRDVS